MIAYLAIGIVLLYSAMNGYFAPYLGFSILLAQMLYYDDLRARNKGAESLLAHRLEAYANLHGVKDCGNKYILTSNAHRILLGTIKKVEAKAASLLVFLVLTITLTITLTTVVDSSDTNTKIFLVAVIFLHPGAVASVLQCFKQIDTFDLKQGGVLEYELQSALLSQLMVKEYKFRFAYEMTLVILIAGFSGLVIWMIPL